MMNPFRPRLLAFSLALACTGALAQSAPADSGSTAPQPTALTMESGGQMPELQKKLSFDHAELHFVVQPERQRIEGRALLTFTAKQPTDTVLLDLDRNLPISKVAVDGHALDASRWSNPEGRLSVSLGKTLAVGKSVTVEVDYAGQPHVAKKAPWDGGFVWAKTPDGQPWVASAVEGEGCDLFWPCIDQPTGEPDLVDTYITVPKSLAAPGNGKLIDIKAHGDSHTYHWRARHPDTYAIAIDVGPFKLLKGEYKSRYGNTIPMEFWYLPANEQKARGLFAELPRMLDFFEQEIGPYPWGDEKVGMVETPHLGMEHQTINAYGNGYKKSPYGFDWLLQHEFSHEYFGNQVTNVDWDDMWLHEGFGTYMQPLYSQYLNGDMPYFAMLQEERNALKNVYPIVAGHSQTESQVYDADHGPGNDIYYKGSLMLHSLRQLIGDEAFFTSIRELVYGRPDPRPGNFQPRYASTRDYIDIVNKVAGKDYSWFFNVYLYQAQLPVLEESRQGDTLTLHWKTQDNKPFPMPVEVQVGYRTTTLPMTDGSGSVTVPAGGLYIIDPRSKVLRANPAIDAYQAWRKEQMQATKDGKH